jgi:membrane protease subunit HflK
MAKESGFRTVGPDERALVLRFGKIQGVTDQRVLGPGAHWVLPYPIDEVVKIPVEQKINLPVNSFWYYQTKEDILGETPKSRTRIPIELDPVKDGYCLTRSEASGKAPSTSGRGGRKIRVEITYEKGDIDVSYKKYEPEGQGDEPTGHDGSDYNIVHSKWQLTYQISDIELFFKNVYVQDVKPGQVYSEIMQQSITPLLNSVFEDAVVDAMVYYTVDEAIKSKDRIPQHVHKLVQTKLDEMESGVRVESVYLTDVTWPRQVNDAFLASIRASQESQKAISEARTYAENTINETAGPIAQELFLILHDDNVSQERKDLLWSQVAGKAQEIIAESKAYRTKTVEAAKANADYFQRMLPGYRERPKLVVQELYQDTIEYVLENADEKFIIQPTEGIKDRELRILLNRDPTLKQKSPSTER